MTNIEPLFDKYKEQSFSEIKESYHNIFDQIYKEEKHWLDNLENKTFWLKNPNDRDSVEYTISKLKDRAYLFSEKDTDHLGTFTRIINTIVRIANRINNFKQGVPIDNGVLDLPTLFNNIKQTDNFSDLSINLNKNLTSFLPHLFSIIKHSQCPEEYPIYYKYWSNITSNVLGIPKNYDTICEFYRGFPKDKRHLNFGSYMGTIGIELANDLSKGAYIKEEGDKIYKYIKDEILNLPKYFNLIDRYKKHPRYYIIGSKYGEKANYDVFPEMVKQSVIAIGFAKDIDLDSYFGEDEQVIASYLSENGEESKSVKALQKFLNLRPGDFIAIKGSGSPKGSTGYLSIIGYARVIVKDGRTYEHQPANLGHIIHVEYLNSSIKNEFQLGGYGKTIHLLTKQEHIKSIFKSENMAVDPFSPFRQWLEDTYVQDDGKKLEKDAVENHIASIKTTNAEILAKQLSDKELYEINDTPTLKKLKKVYFSIPEIKDKDDQENGRYNTSFNRFIEFIGDKFYGSNKSKTPLNQILYGPPGTGKTYHTINRALEILGYNFENKKREEIKQDFEDKVKSGQIVFTTFHQSLSYEDFIEGLKPITPKKEGNPLRYKVVDGIFKQICKNSIPFQIGDDINGYIVESVTPELLTLKKKRSDTLLPVSFRMLYGLNKYLTEKGLSADNVKEKISFTEEDKSTYPEIEPYLINGYNTIIPNLLNKLNNPISDHTHKVLIIDEINRGNVSQIFGELITLIEKDKRLGNSEELTVTLPYSKKSFGVPSNLYIIGTMNTADRSVEALDTALRRRFVFEEMTPKPEKIAEIRREKKLDEKIANIDLELLLLTINHRVEKLLDRDHTIGHSYFLNCKDIKDLKNTIYKNIIPLLQEYFHGDYAKIGLVMGAGFIRVKNSTISFATFEHDGIDIFNDRKVYEIVDYRDKEKQTILYKDKSYEVTFDDAINLLLNRTIKSNSEEERE